jgi:CheY-like chemotaxis protein
MATRRCVVVADDNADLLDMMILVLQAHGFDAHAAEDGHSALALVERHRPHVVILDLGMPVIDGYEAARHIRAQPWGEKVKLIAHSGYGRREDVHRAHAAGFDVHCTKPVDPSELLMMIESAVGAPPRAQAGTPQTPTSSSSSGA